MWDSWQQPHRQHVELALRCIPEFQSLYEIGCGAGPNLRGIRQAYPHVRLGGSEPNPVYAQWTSEKLQIAVYQVKLPDVPTRDWDVVLACYVFSYAEPEVVYETLRRIQARYLVITEPSPFISPFYKPGLYADGPKLPCQVHDYLELTRAAGWLLKWRWPIHPHYMGLNMILVAERA
jgi:hypothetical protein